VNTEQLLRRADISYRQLTYWTSKGWLRPINPGCGSGYNYEFTADEVRVALLMGRLVRAAIAPKAAHRVARGETVLAEGIEIVIDRDTQSEAVATRMVGAGR
jgi:hypothetical protein